MNPSSFVQVILKADCEFIELVVLPSFRQQINKPYVKKLLLILLDRCLNKMNDKSLILMTEIWLNYPEVMNETIGGMKKIVGHDQLEFNY